MSTTGPSLMEHDVIDSLLGIEPGSAVDQVRRGRPETRLYLQKSYEALFYPTDPGQVSGLERFAVAAYLAELHREPVTRAFYGRMLADADFVLAESIRDLAAASATEGPYGCYPPETDVHDEDVTGLRFSVPSSFHGELGPGLRAALEHTHLLVFRPRESSADAIADLENAGWSPDAMVTLSQLVSYLCFQVRVIGGLALMKESK